MRRLICATDDRKVLLQYKNDTTVIAAVDIWPIIEQAQRDLKQGKLVLALSDACSKCHLWVTKFGM
jgi:hypothetical protein